MTFIDPKATFGVRGIESGDTFGIDPRAEKSPTDPRAAVQMSMRRCSRRRNRDVDAEDYCDVRLA
jgi:hypothetical protein